MGSPSPDLPQDSIGGSSSSGPPLLAYALVALITAAIVSALWLFYGRDEPPPIEVHPPPEADVEPTVTPTPTPTAAPVTVHVSGAVAEPGVYELAPDSRAVDALEAAGGFSNEADRNAVNLAETVLDGSQVYIPTLDEQAAEPPAGVSGGERTVGIELMQETAVHLNTATQEELETLSGIGPAKAQAIIEGRPYESLEDLLKVSGIGEKTLESIRDKLDLQ